VGIEKTDDTSTTIRRHPMIRVGAVGQIKRTASETSLDVRVETAQPSLPRPRVAVEMDAAVQPPAA
jgi:hypothetical protein